MHQPDNITQEGHRGTLALASLAVVAALGGGVVALRSQGHASPHTVSNTSAPPQRLASTATHNLITTGQWSYLPGATHTTAGLQIAYRGFAVVEQDGSGGQANPPVNLYGTRLQVGGDFRVSATLTSLHGPAALQLYGAVSQVSDEFRVEPQSVRLTLDQNKLTIDLWNGQATQDLANQKPAEERVFTFTAMGTSPTVTVSDTRGKLTFGINGQQLGTLADQHVFAKGEVWFGANAEAPGGSFTIADLEAQGVNGGTVQIVDTSAARPIAKKATGLQQLADKKRSNFLIGSDAALWAATSNTEYAQTLLGGDFGIITPENAMKWQFTEPQPGVYDFHEADALVNWATKNGLQVHGHNLVFSEALPHWVQSLPTNTPAQKAYVKQVLVNHVTALVTHFKSQVHEWDINEVFADYDDNGDFTQTFRDNVFYRAMGADYIKIAAEAAVAADPTTKIYINDYGAETDTDARWAAMYAALKQWKAEGVPIYGFGFESHIYDADTDAIVGSHGNALILNQHINALAAVGLKSRISEMDVTGDNGEAWRANQFAGVLKTCLNNPNCMAFSIWSTGPTDVWQDDDTHALEDTSVDSPFDQAMRPNQSYAALQRVLE